MNSRRIVFSLLAMLLAVSSSAIRPADSLRIAVRAGYSLGASTPTSIPASIRKLNSFALTPNFLVGVDLYYPLSGQWGLQTGLHFENKGMKAAVTTKAYYMEVVKGDQQMAGLFTGQVEQKVKQWMLTIPLQATLKLGSKVILKGGPYVSFLLKKEFSGIASDGYLRKDGIQRRYAQRAVWHRHWC